MTDQQLMDSKQKIQSPIAERFRIDWSTPAVDVYETDEGLVVQADLPGVVENDLQLQASRGVLTLEAVATDRNSSGHRGFYRQFKLSDQIDAAAATAALKNGVLTLRLPKKEDARPKRISVRTLH